MSKDDVEDLGSSRGSAAFMPVDNAIDLVVERRGNPYEWDHELMEAAESLAAEVAFLRKMIREECKYREKRWLADKNPYTQARLHEAKEIETRSNIRQ